jgi:hypothetical protein
VPEMKIDGASDALEFIDIWYRVFAYMRWPEDEQRRRAHIATAFVGGLDAAETMERPRRYGAGTFRRSSWGRI